MSDDELKYVTTARDELQQSVILGASPKQARLAEEAGKEHSAEP
jgi:hypothetical protein